jgi:hypothetical protein
VESLTDIFDHLVGQPHLGTKPRHFYEVYDRYFSEHRRNYTNIAEIGIHTGESLHVLSRYFDSARILGIDTELVDVRFGNNVDCVKCDQTDRARLLSTADQYAPVGFDVIIDDASHIGQYSLQTFLTLFNRVKVGGFYVVEDWQTGYFEDWVDGGRHSPVLEDHEGAPPERLTSHDFGMVGFVKWLVDILGDSDPSTSPFEYLHFYQGIVIIRKKGDYNAELQDVGSGKKLISSHLVDLTYALHKQNHQLQDKLEVVQSSLSWRITKPLRSALTVLGRLRHTYTKRLNGRTSRSKL